jgi:DNA-binding winged helix-turn-helix (wHTH) protein/tetratricopeptide (TPR) repeat protein
MTNEAKHLYEFGPFRVDPDRRLLLRDLHPVPLQPKAFDTLLVLIRNSETVVLKDDLMKSVWPDTFVEESNLAQNIFVLRKTLGETVGDHRYIVTVPGRGYRFTEKVRSVPQGGDLVLESRSITRMVIDEQTVPSRWWRWVGLGAAFVAIVLLAGTWYWRSHRNSTLSEKDTIVVADFANTTGDSVFDGTLRQALSAQLEQSPFLNLLSEQRIGQTLSLMGQPRDARLTHDVAREVCQRTAGAAVLDGSIAQVGSSYLVTLRALDCSTGDTLTTATEQTSDKNHVLDALGKIASGIRGKLGESLASVQKYDVPPESVTTPSLEALRSYTLAMKARKSDLVQPIPLFQRAIDLDPNFAMAHAQLGVDYYNLGESAQAAAELRQAYALRERLSEREKFYIAAHYDDMVTGNLEAASKEYEVWAQIYPRDGVPRGNLGIIYLLLGRYDDALVMAQKDVALRTPSRPDPNLAAAYLYVNRLNEARATALEGIRNQDSPHYHSVLYSIDFLQHDQAGMEQESAALTGKPGWEDVLLYKQAATAAFSGRFVEARALATRASESAQRASEKQAAADYEAQAAMNEALVDNMDRAKQRAQAALALSHGREVEGRSAIALGIAGDLAQATRLADDLNNSYPENTIVLVDFLPTIRAAIAIQGRNSSKALVELEAAAPYELSFTLYPVYLRGQAYLYNKQGSAAIAEFQKILDHPGVVQNEPIGALAHLELGRAYALTGDQSKAKAAYQDFLKLWKDADPDIPVLKQAKAEYAKLQ